jgi:alanine racemase
VSSLVACSEQRAEHEPLSVSGSSDIHGSVLNDTIVQRNCTLHVRGNLLGSLTIEQGANVVVEGSVDGKIVNKGGRLLVNNKGLAACVALDGPPEAEAGGILKVNLTNIAANFETLSKRTDAECAAVVKANAYGCGIGPVAAALAKSHCRIFFVSNLAEARSVRAAAPEAVIYVVNGFYSGTGPAFAEINARPVINSSVELAEWDFFVGSSGWAGSFALNVDTGESSLGLSMEEAAAFAPRVHSPDHRISLLMGHLDYADTSRHALNERRLGQFRDLRRLYDGVPASLADSFGIFFGAMAHFDLVRAGGALYGLNPLPGAANPMLPVVELRARIVQVRNLAAGKTIAERIGNGLTAKRAMRLALVSIGYADGYPHAANGPLGKLQAIVGGHRCPVAAAPSTDLLAIDVTDLPDKSAARPGEMATLIGAEIGVDDLAAAVKSTGREVLTRLGHRFHRVYYTI